MIMTSTSALQDYKETCRNIVADYGIISADCEDGSGGTPFSQIVVHCDGSIKKNKRKARVPVRPIVRMRLQLNFQQILKRIANTLTTILDPVEWEH